MKNLRPITLLNTDYKIVEKMIARRMEIILPKIIHPDQTGFMTNWRISTNIRKVLDLIQFCNNNQVEAILINLDFIKCFDRISFDCIKGSLEFFGFPPYVVTWVTILYQNFRIIIQNNGKFSEEVKVNRSVHQGGCMSVQIFLLCAELIALELRQCRNIQGIPVDEILFLLNQYADDMGISSLFNQESVENIFQTLEWFRRNTGFTLSYEKTSILRIGSLWNSNAQLYTMNQIAWTNDPVNVLGVNISPDIAKQLGNYHDVIQKIDGILATWRCRGLSLLGKVNIVNSLIASLFIYKFAVLPNMTDKMLQAVEQKIINFLWNGKKAKIKMSILQASKPNGGVKLVNLKMRQCAIKASWIQILSRDRKLATLVYHFTNAHLKDHIWRCNFDKQDVLFILKESCNIFWYQVLQAWADYNFEQNPTMAKSQIIWYNSHIKIGGRLVWWEKAFHKGLVYVHQLFQGGEVKSAISIFNEFGISFMEYNSLISAIPKSWRCSMPSEQIVHDFKFDRLVDKGSVAADIYKVMIETDYIPNCEDKWSVKGDIDANFTRSLRKAFKTLYITTNIPKLRSFQYRLLHRALVLNSHLFRWGLTEDNLCTFCKETKETIEHLLVECHFSQTVWFAMQNFVKRFSNETFSLQKSQLLLNCVHPNPGHVFNFICLVTKQYLYRKRCQKDLPNVNELNGVILSYENVEKYNAIKNNMLVKHQKKWHPGRIVEEITVEEFSKSYLT